MGWATRKVLARRVSNTMDYSFCVEALEEALSRYGKAADIQHRSGQPVYQPGVHRRVAGRRNRDQHGWPGALDKRCLLVSVET